MYQEMWGKLLDMRPATTRKGNPCTVCRIEAQGKWNPEANGEQTG